MSYATDSMEIFSSSDPDDPWHTLRLMAFVDQNIEHDAWHDGALDAEAIKSKYERPMLVELLKFAQGQIDKIDQA